jgi:hypothetical protein
MLIVAVLALTVVFLSTAAAPAASKGTLASVSAKSSPKTDKKSPFKFKVTGALALPSSFCAPGAGGNCIPLNCGAGVTNPKYCGAPAIASLCAGKVQVTFKKGSKTVGKKTAKVNPATCKYSAKASFKDKKGKKAKLKGVKLKVVAKFLGNTVFSAKSSKSFKVTVGKKASKR